ncbi:MAG: PAS domain S-box protein [Desulforhopalus sp.]|nr:PAS domain S-box protein [Desulforhopalus sp.]
MAFNARGYETDAVMNIAEANEAFSRSQYHVAVLDYYLPDGQGDSLLLRIRAEHPDCVCIMMTTDPNPQLALDWMKQGAAAYVRKPFEPKYLLELCGRARRERSLLRVEELLEFRTRQLRESENQHREFTDTLPIGVFEADDRGTLLFVNRCAFTMFGVNPDDFSPGSLDFWQMIAPSDIVRARANFGRALASDHSPPVEYLGQGQNGQIFPVLVQSQRILRQGAPVRIRGILMDISERKRAENELAQSQRMLRKSIEGATRAADSLRQRVDELAALNALSRSINTSLSLTQTVSAALEGILKAIQPDLAFLFLREGDRLVLLGLLPEARRKRLGEIPEHRVGECMCGLAVRQQRALYSRDISADSRCTWEECKMAGIRSFAALPLRSGAEEVIGVIGLASETERDFEQQGSYLETLATQVSIAMANSRLHEDVRLELVERRQAEEALRESQATFRDLFEKSADAILLIDQSRVFVECNQAALNLLKMSRRELLNRPPVMISPEFQPDGRRSDEAAQEMIDQAYDKGLHRFDWTCVNSEGGEFIVDVSLMPILINGQNMLHTTWRDITERKQVETELQKSKLITDSIPVGLHLYHLEELSNDRTLRMVYANPAAKALTSLEPEEVVGKTLDENFPGLRALGIPQRYAEVVRTQTAITFEDITYGDNRVVLASFSVSAFPLPGNMVGIAFENITERKRMEEALRLSETGLRQLFQESPLSTMLFDKDTGDLVDVNAAALNAYGCSTREELRGYDFWCDPPYSFADALVWNRKASEEGSQQFQWLSQKKSGEFFWEDVFLRRLDIQGQPRIIAVSVDITERKRIEEERRKLQTQLNHAQKMESVGRLAGGVAHDFNNMLGVILGYTEMSLNKTEPSHPLFGHLQKIHKAAERSATLTGQLLAFARKQTVAPKVLDLNKTVEGMLQMLRRLIGEDINLAWRPGRALYPVFVDPSQVDQILANLCVNARDAIADTGKVTIETGNVSFDEAYTTNHAGFVPGEFVMLAVSDNGCGMDGETLGHIFEPFFTTKEPGKGTGLGLAMVYGIVKQNNGFINVYSEPDHGTTFKISLPQHATKAFPRTEPKQAQAAVTGCETILLVEDELDILKMSTMMLEEMGYTVIAAGTPGEAIHLAREHQGRIDLLMTDVVMPEMNGRDLAGNIMSIYPDIKRLFMSGYTANVIAHHGVLDEGINFIQKPFSMKDLGGKLREALES